MENVDILIEHGTLLTLNQERQIIADGAVAIRQGPHRRGRQDGEPSRAVQGEQDD